MVSLIVFSKDRPMQLDLTLRSIDRNISFTKKVYVIFKASNQEFLDAYIHLQHEHKNVFFYCQRELSLNFILPSLMDHEYVCFMTDDGIVYRKSLTTDLDISKMFSFDNMSCLSLRIGRNTTKRKYGTSPVLEDDRLPPQYVILQRGQHLIYDRVYAPYGGYWNYPMSVDGHIIPTSYVDLTYKTYYTPNQFEDGFQRYTYGNYSSCEIHSCYVNSPNNRVQNEYQNRSGDDFPLDSNELLFLFNQGKRIDLDKLDFSNVNCPHTEIDLMKGLI